MEEENREDDNGSNGMALASSSTTETSIGIPTYDRDIDRHKDRRCSLLLPINSCYIKYF